MAKKKVVKGLWSKSEVALLRACCVEFKFSIYNAIHVTYSMASERES